MDEHSNPARHDDQSRAAARRFLRVFAWLVGITALVVASVNLVAYRYMLRADNQDIVQLLSGWGRMYKPILYDELKPKVAVFGASWARDAFDPIETSRLVGRAVFNHGVSGGSDYETRRFADAALDNPDLEAAIVNLDTFYRDEIGARTRYGFDESILEVDADLRPNRWVGLRRAYSLALTGWAAGANLNLIKAIHARDSGVAKPDYLRSYEIANLTWHAQEIDETRKRIFPEPGSDPIKSPGPSVDWRQMAPPAELAILIDRFCDRGVDVYAYYTPSHTRNQACDLQASREIATLEFLRRKQASCNAKISYFDFSYPNAVTLEGVLIPVEASEYWRPDDHPRPTVGLLMAARMFGREFPAGTQPILTQDFGADLMSHEDAEGWLIDRSARCEGDWSDKGYASYVEALTEP
ncbi:MAG: hypothetical protein OEN02_04695 [Gammaproteobacteria bacterium]|nr:hypothetical protein [Gammaproteobacteria bacterium]MDH3537452.1 hypothetical protein [Gammaproteobacteria bacterium]